MCTNTNYWSQEDLVVAERLPLERSQRLGLSEEQVLRLLAVEGQARSARTIQTTLERARLGNQLTQVVRLAQVVCSERSQQPHREFLAVRLRRAGLQATTMRLAL